MSEKRCGECKWWKLTADFPGKGWCRCPLPVSLWLGDDGDIEMQDKSRAIPACPAFDDGSYDNAVRGLVKWTGRWLDISDGECGLDDAETEARGQTKKAIAAVEKMLAEREKRGAK